MARCPCPDINDQRGGAMQLAKIGMLAGMILLRVAASEAAIISVEPDDFAPGTDISAANPAVSLSVEGPPDAVVEAVVGSSGACGPPGPCASTGLHVFGPATSASGRWQRGSGEFRADFKLPSNFVALDLVGLDDGAAELRAFASDGTLLDTFNVFLTGPGHNVTAFIKRPRREIAYILAGGVVGESIGIDHLQFEVPGPSYPTLLRGPLQDDGSGVLEPFADFDGDGVPDQGRFIVVGVEQHFSFAVDITNHGEASDLDNLAFVQELPFEFLLSMEAEEDMDGCADGTCDGISEDLACPVFLSGPLSKKEDPDPRLIAIQAILDAGVTCRTHIHVKTKPNSGKGKGQGRTGRFEPSTCSLIETGDGLLMNTVDLGGDIRLFNTTDDQPIGVVGHPIQLQAIDCP